MKASDLNNLSNYIQEYLDGQSSMAQPMVVPDGCEVECKVKGFPPKTECRLVCK